MCRSIPTAWHLKRKPYTTHYVRVMSAMIFLDVQQYVVGGLLLGCGVGFLYLSAGVIVDVISSYASLLATFFKGSFFGKKSYVDRQTVYLVYILGLVLGGLSYSLFIQGTFPHTEVSEVEMFVGGVFVGLGATITGGSLLSHGTYLISEMGRVTGLVSLAFLSIVFSVAYLTRLILLP